MYHIFLEFPDRILPFYQTLLPPNTFHLSLVHILLVYQTLNTVEVVAENINSGFGDHKTYIIKAITAVNI